MNDSHTILWSRLGKACVLALLAAHVLLVLHHFPVERARNGEPYISGDLCNHAIAAWQGDHFVRGQGKMWGYSPTFMAGYPWGIWQSVSKRGVEVATTCLPGTSPAMALWIWFVFMTLVTPLIIPLACWVMGCEKSTVWLSTALSLIVYQFGNIVTYFWTVGNVPFPFVCALSVLYVALLYRAIERAKCPACAEATAGKQVSGLRGMSARQASVERGAVLSACPAKPGALWSVVRSPWSVVRRVWSVVAPGFLLGAIFWLHPLGIVPAGLGTLAVMGVQHQRLRQFKTWMMLSVVAGMSMFLVWPWLSLLFKYWDLRADASAGLPGGIKYLIMDCFSDRAYTHPYDRRAFFHVMVVLGAVGTWCSIRTRMKGVVVLGVTAGALLLASHAFQYMPLLSATQPYRYMVSLMLFGIIPASVGLKMLAERVVRAHREERVVVLCLLAILLPAFIGYGFDVLQREPVHGLEGDRYSVATWIKNHPDMRGRVLCEDDELGSVLPYYGGREVIGSYYSNAAPLVHHWASFDEGRAFYVADLTPETLWRRMSLFNIGMVVSKTPELSSLLSSLDDRVVRQARMGGLTMWSVKPSCLSDVWGEGTSNDVHVTASPNRIVIDNAPAGRFVIKYHLFHTLVATEGVQLLPKPCLDDPVPFIEVNNPNGLKQIEIWNAY